MKDTELYKDHRSKDTHSPDGYELLTHESGHLEYDFKWRLGPYWSRFLAEMRDNEKFMAVKCPECGKVYFPPRQVCGACFAEMNEWVEVGPEGELKGFTIVRFPYIDPNVGTLVPTPLTDVFVRLDGADTNFMHHLKETEEEEIEVGMRVTPVWADKPRPTTVHALKHFERKK